MNATLIPVKSSAVRAYGYDAATQVLTIETPPGKDKPGRTYRYADVPQAVVTEFVESDSIGRAWGSLIRGKFSLVTEEAES